MDQLTLLYEQINTMKKKIPYKDKAKSRYTLHYVQDKLSTSKGLCSESVIMSDNLAWLAMSDGKWPGRASVKYRSLDNDINILGHADRWRGRISHQQTGGAAAKKNHLVCQGPQPLNGRFKDLKVGIVLHCRTVATVF